VCAHLKWTHDTTTLACTILPECRRATDSKEKVIMAILAHRFPGVSLEERMSMAMAIAGGRTSRPKAALDHEALDAIKAMDADMRQPFSNLQRELEGATFLKCLKKQG